ncbi:MAG: peptidoglycan DD-metalloendopeptidase family protein [Acidimicrobiaceae bacterium]|nr:peptidoglycan DD-metalloendopeptidase family protein [Acidimicrobiaceae bacterium]
MTRLHRLIVACIGLCLLAQLIPSGVSAQTEQIDQLRSDRDAVRADRARAAADLDPLLSANEQIEEALRVLTEDLASRQAELDATRFQLERARIEVIAAQDEVVLEQQRIADLRLQLQRQAITAYVQPRGTGDDDVFRASDLNEGERRRALVSAVQTSQADILDDLRVAEANRELAVARAENAQRNIESRELQAQRQVTQVDEAIANQQRLEAILVERIAEFQEEVDLLAVDEANLQAEITGLIIEEEQRAAAIREAARIQAERERVAREEEQRRQAQIAAATRGEASAVEAPVSRANAALVGAPSGQGLTWPVNGTVTSNFGPRWGRQHNGIDIAANTGTTVASAGSGTVIAAGFSGGFGQRVLIQHSGGLVTLYAHLSSINVSTGQSVSSGTSIGAVGCTGSCTGPHLHFETRVGGTAYDPRSYLG